MKSAKGQAFVTDASKPIVPDALSRSPLIRTVEFDTRAIDPIAEVLDVAATVAPFRLPSSTVWQMTVPGAAGRPVAMVTLWPGIGRVDVVAGQATVVFTGVVRVELVPGVEVQFRRANREVLIVARGGRVIVRV
ncbi:MAG: hypothetical protein AVDCRST_MAG43-994 [uncultured Thermomicrobiales bacterium]|uniref:Uncharacterized protein n=1 Tax=uncultured Thermomicrobiales bacterium TaxID=1645740 RepID=A0A6J4UKY6_9BACT|nr:MAG: hypothetical protein AVDCRST_MAG43-994 [uncultured Thermomicrobiales bacterium]